MAMTTVERADTPPVPPRDERRSALGAARLRFTRAARGMGPRRAVFRAVMATFIVVIAASYTVPLWFQLHGDRLLVVTSGSMEPEIAVGAAVVIRPITNGSQLRVGQVVTYWRTGDSQMVTHRIIALTSVMRLTNDARHEPILDESGKPIMDPFIQTKGDNNPVADANLTPVTQVRGVVREVHTGWGYLLAWAHSAAGRFLLFTPPLLLLLGAELLSRVPARWSAANWNKTLVAMRSREAASSGPLGRTDTKSSGEHTD